MPGDLAERVPAQLSKRVITLSIYPFIAHAIVPADRSRRISMLMYLDPVSSVVIS